MSVRDALRHHGIAIRPGTPDDLDALVSLEERIFTGDRLSRRSFRRLLERPTARFVVAGDRDRILGYALILFRARTALARLYSIAVDPAARGQGLGARLLDAAEHAAFDHGCILMRLEVRADNAAAIALYEKRGYRQFGRYLAYYDDDADALRLEKRLIEKPVGSARGDARPAPYYPQTTDFTCGPACMMMALAALGLMKKPDRRTELRLWREATTIFMTAGLGGCEPFGMATALARRGAKVEIWSSRGEFFFTKSVRRDEEREIMRLVQEDYRAEARAMGIPLHRRAIRRRELKEALEDHAVAIVLVSGYKLFRDRTPHWVLAHDCDERHIWIHDPWIADSDHESAVAVAGLPIPWADFDHMTRTGRERRAAAIIISGERKP